MPIHAITAQTELKRPEALADLRMLADLLESIKTTLANSAPVIYEQNLQGILHDLSPAQKGGLAAAWAFSISATYRSARASILSIRNGKAPSKTLVSEITSALNDLKNWRDASDGKSVPIAVDGTAEHVTAVRRLADDVEFLAKILPAKRVNQLSLDELGSLVSGLQADHRTLHQIQKLNQIERSLAASGVEKLAAEIRSQKPEVRLRPQIFEYAWFRVVAQLRHGTTESCQGPQAKTTAELWLQWSLSRADNGVLLYQGIERINYNPRFPSLSWRFYAFTWFLLFTSSHDAALREVLTVISIRTTMCR